MATLTQIQTNIRQFFNDNWTETDIAWENREYKPDLTKEWVRLSILLNKTFMEEIGTSASLTGYRNGMVIVQVFTPLSNGIMDSINYCDQIESLFRRTNLDDIYFGESYTTVIGADDAWYQINVNCPFWSWD